MNAVFVRYRLCDARTHFVDSCTKNDLKLEFTKYPVESRVLRRVARRNDVLLYSYIPKTREFTKKNWFFFYENRLVNSKYFTVGQLNVPRSACQIEI